MLISVLHYAGQQSNWRPRRRWIKAQRRYRLKRVLRNSAPCAFPDCANEKTHFGRPRYNKSLSMFHKNPIFAPFHFKLIRNISERELGRENDVQYHLGWIIYYVTFHQEDFKHSSQTSDFYGMYLASYPSSYNIIFPLLNSVYTTSATKLGIISFHSERL